MGIVGSTGAGKSTLIELLVGVLEPSEGRVSADGSSIHDGRRAWQQRLGYVPQTIFLLDDSLRRNIALGVPDPEIDEARVREVLRQAQLETFVESLPEGLDTRVGEGGVRLSGGERQRLGVARALYPRPAVLVLDEATSALDAVTEAALLGAMRELPQRPTQVVVTHRVASLRGSDRLVLLERGRIADAGTYGELVARSAAFRALAESAEADGAKAS